MFCENVFTTVPPVAENQFSIMKKYALYVMALLMLLSIVPAQLNAGPGIVPVPTDPPKTVDSIAINTITLRINEIKSMDKSNLSSIERKQLKEEVKLLKTQLKAAGGGVYLSVGAILLIILVLVLIL